MRLTLPVALLVGAFFMSGPSHAAGKVPEEPAARPQAHVQLHPAPKATPAPRAHPAAPVVCPAPAAPVIIHTLPVAPAPVAKPVEPPKAPTVWEKLSEIDYAKIGYLAAVILAAGIIIHALRGVYTAWKATKPA